MLSNLDTNLKTRDRNLNFNLSDANSSMQVLDNQGKENVSGQLSVLRSFLIFQSIEIDQYTMEFVKTVRYATSNIWFLNSSVFLFCISKVSIL